MLTSSLIPRGFPRGCFQLALGLVAWTAPVVAQDAATQGPASAESVAEQPTAPVVLDGVTLFRVRGVSAFPAEKRAAGIAEWIAALAANRTIPVDSILVRETPLGSEVVAPSND
jgi:hypothetical protein